jgi:2-oxo-3-hexenedioate decarboxylase
MSPPGRPMSTAVHAARLMQARDAAQRLPLITAAEPAFTLADAYAVAEQTRSLRIARGERTLGYKIGFTNRSIWSRYGVYAPVWGPVWDSTLSLLDGPQAQLSLSGLVQPRLEPEIVFGFAHAPRAGMSEAELTQCLAWVAHGVEIVQTHFAEWRFAAPDTVADFALHGRLLVGPRVAVSEFAALGSDLAALALDLRRGDEDVDRGQGSVVLDSPLTALRLWVDAMAAQTPAWPIRPGDVVTTGTITDAWPLLPGQRWSTRLSDARLPGLVIDVVE